MTTFNSIWTTSLNQAFQLQKKNSPLSIGGLQSASGSSGTGLLGQINTAKGLQGPLDMLLSVVSKSVSDVMASYSPTQGINFSNSFKSAFSLSPFQQTSMTMNNSIAANSISNLTKGIFSQATSAKSMTTQEKSNLMTTLLSGVNLGFLNSKSLLDSQGLLTEMIHESLNNLQNNVQSNIGGYYDSVIGKSLNIYENLTETGITTSVTPPPVTTTPEITTIVTPPESVTTTPGIASEVTPDVVVSPEEVTTPPVVPEVSETSPLDGIWTIIDDPSFKEVVDGVSKQAFIHGSGAWLNIKHGDYTVGERVLKTDASGVAHDIVDITKLITEPGSEGWEVSYVVDGDKAFNSLDDAENYIDTISAYVIKDKSGNTHSFKGVFENGVYAGVEMDGVGMNSSELVQWAKVNGTEKVTGSFSDGTPYSSNYQVEAVTPNGNMNITIASTTPSNESSMFESTDNNAWNFDFFFKDEAGGLHHMAGGDDWGVNGVVDGNTMEADALAQWAEDHGLEKRTVSEGGNTVEVWYADVVSESGSAKAEFIRKVNGDAKSVSHYLGNGIRVETPGGESYYIAENQEWDGSDVKWFSIDGFAVNSSEAVDMMKSATNLQKSSFEFDGTQYDVYSDGGDYNKFTVDTSTGKLVGDTYYYEQNFQIGGQEVVAKTLYLSGNNKTILEVGGAEMNATELRDWAKSNGVETYQVTDKNGNKFDYYVGNDNKDVLVDANGNVSYENLQKTELFLNENKITYLQSTNYRGINSIQVNGEEVSAEEMNDWLVENGEKILSATDASGKEYSIYSLANGKGIAVDNESGENSLVSISNVQHNANGNSISEISIEGTVQFHQYEVNGEKMSKEEMLAWAKDGNLNEIIEVREGLIGSVEIKHYTADDGTTVIAEAQGMIFNSKELQIFNMQIDPIALDMNGDGIQTVSAENGVEFDLLGTGQAVKTGWTAGGDDALLALDRNNSGAIESGKELFGDQWGAANGYEELAKFDENNDGVIDNRDKVYSNLKLWNDVNMNGMSEAGELRGLAESGVASISTGFKTSSLVDAAGNEHRQVSSFTKTNGQKGVTTDLWFRYYGITSYINNQFLR